MPQAVPSEHVEKLKALLWEFQEMDPADPADKDNAQAIETRTRMWRDRQAPAGVAFPGDLREWEKKRYPRAELSPLGRRLLGLESWK